VATVAGVDGFDKCCSACNMNAACTAYTLASSTKTCTLYSAVTGTTDMGADSGYFSGVNSEVSIGAVLSNNFRAWNLTACCSPGAACAASCLMIETSRLDAATLAAGWHRLTVVSSEPSASYPNGVQRIHIDGAPHAGAGVRGTVGEVDTQITADVYAVGNHIDAATDPAKVSPWGPMAPLRIYEWYSDAYELTPAQLRGASVTCRLRQGSTCGDGNGVLGSWTSVDTAAKCRAMCESYVDAAGCAFNSATKACSAYLKCALAPAADQPESHAAQCESMGGYKWKWVTEGISGQPSRWYGRNNKMRQDKWTTSPWQYTSRCNDVKNAYKRVGDEKEVLMGRGSFMVLDDDAARLWTDYQFETTVRPNHQRGIGLMWRYQDPDNYYRFNIQADSGTCSRVEKVVAGVYAQLNFTSNLKVVAYDSYKVRVVVRGAAFQVYMRPTMNTAEPETLVIEGADADLTHGSVGFNQWASTVDVDFVKVTSLPPLPAATSNEDLASIGAYPTKRQSTGGSFASIGTKRAKAPDTCAPLVTHNAAPYLAPALPLGPSTAVTFTVRHGQGAFLALIENSATPATSAFYEVQIGGWNNSFSVLRKGTDFESPTNVAALIQPVATAGILSNDTSKGFWLAYDNARVQFGRGSIIGSDELFSFTDPSPLQVDAYSVRSDWEGGAGGAGLGILSAASWEVCVRGADSFPVRVSPMQRSVGAGAQVVQSLASCPSAARTVAENAPARYALAAPIPSRILPGPTFPKTSTRDFSIRGKGTGWMGRELFGIDGSTGQLFIRGGGAATKVDYERFSSVQLTVLSRESGFDSGWFHFRSGAGEKSFKEIAHSVRGAPDSALLVRVAVRAVDGPNKGFVFPGVTSARDDDDYYSNYGGLLFAYSATAVRLWAPSVNNYGNHIYGDPAIVNIGDGWGAVFKDGGESNVQVASNPVF
jgi:hypothetical protein